MISNYLFWTDPSLRGRWDGGGFLLLALTNLTLMAVLFLQLRLLNQRYYSSQSLQLTLKLFESQLEDQRYKGLVCERGGVSSFLAMNYHFIGLVKKFLIFLVLVVPANNFRT